MRLKTTLFGNTYSFKDVKDVLAKANEEKSGDILAGVAAESTVERIAAKTVLADMTLEDLRNNPVVPYELDDITRVDQDSVDETVYGDIKGLTVGDFRELLLSASEAEIASIRPALTSEMIAAVAKLMSNMDLVYAAKKMHVEATCNTTIGKPGTLSSRLQPNHATDDVAGIMASVMEGISYGVGDAVIGLNPAVDAIDSVADILKEFKEFMHKWDIPTQNCVLAHVTTQMKVLEKNLAPMDLMFQSLAGSEVASRAFGINVKLMDEAYAIMKERKSSVGPNFMYFETGQGSELSADGNHGADQLVMEARCYAFALHGNEAFDDEGYFDDILMSIVINKVNNLPESKLAKFLSYVADYYDEYGNPRQKSSLGYDDYVTDDDAARTLGYWQDRGYYYFDYGTEDRDHYIEAALTYSVAEVEEMMAGYPIVIERFRIMRQLIIDEFGINLK